MNKRSAMPMVAGLVLAPMAGGASFGDGNGDD